MTVIVTKNSSTASAVPTTSDLVQGELAVNVTDKRIFTENASTQIVELGTNPSTITTATATVTGTLTANGTFASSNAVITGGSINSTPIGATTPSTIVGSTITANTGFVGGLTGNVTGNLTGNVTGNVTGDLTGDVTGNVTASTGTTTLNNLVVNGTADFTNTKLVNVTTPVAGTDAANKSYVDDTVAAVIDSAPAALDTLNELAAALGDDANFSSTVTTALATKLPLAGGTMTGAIAMGTSKITGLGNPTAAQDAATKTYVDTQDALKLNLTGGTMSGAIAMGTNKITGVGDPTLAQDAATKAYTDSILGSATSAADSAAAAATSASNAATSASDAATSATASATSATAAAASYDAFDDRYLGDKASDPTLDNDGNALLTGALYFNTTSDVMKVYDGSAWNIAAVSSASPTFTGTVTADGVVVSEGSSGATANSNADGVVVENNGKTGISILTPNNSEGLIFFGDSDDNNIGRISYNHTTNAMSFVTNNNSRLNIATGGDISFYEDTGTTPKFFWDASAERLGIGTSSPARLLNVAGTQQLVGRFETTNATSCFISLADSTSSNAEDQRIGADGDDLYFGAGGGVERMRIDSSGNVGIGTSSPTNVSSYNSISVNGTTGSLIDSYYGGTLGGRIQAYSSKYLIAAQGASLPLALGTNNIERLRITSSGNVGIGTTSPSAALTLGSVSAISGTTVPSTPSSYNMSVVGTNLNTTGNFISGISFEESNVTRASILAYDAGGSGDSGLVFATQGSATITEAMRIDSSGNVGIGTDSPSSTATSLSNLKIGSYSDTASGIVLAGTTASAISFEDSVSSTAGRVYYNHASDYMAFNTAATERLRIDSSGELTTTNGRVNLITVGRGAGAVSTNTAVGFGALADNTSGGNNVATGYLALRFNTTGGNNTANGYTALYNNTTGANNIATGYESLKSNTTGANNVAVGLQALYSNTTGGSNVASGYRALYVNTTGANNTASGYEALRANTTGGNNSAVGRGSLFYNTTGTGNVATGFEALLSNTTGFSNVAVGTQAGKAITTGTRNTMLGYQAGNSGGSSVSYSTYVGEATGYSSTGDYNTFLGYRSGLLMTTGAKNTILGGFSGNQGGLDIRTSSNNIVLSDGDGNPRQIIDSSGNVVIGSATTNGKLSVVQAASNVITANIECSASTLAYCLDLNTSGATAGNGNFLRGFVSGPTQTLNISNNGDITNTNNSYGAISDERLKENITDSTPKLTDLMKVQVRSYNLKSDPSLKQIGVIAQELEQVFPAMVEETNDHDAEGNDLGTTTKSVKYSVFVPMLIKAMQEQQAIIESLTNRVAALEGN